MTYSWRWAFPGVGRQGWWPVHGTLFRHRRESLNLWLGLWFLQYYFNVVKTIINHPFANGLYHLFMVIWGWFILVLTTLFFMIFAQHIYNIWWWFTIFRIIYHIYHIWEWINRVWYISHFGDLFHITKTSIWRWTIPNIRVMWNIRPAPAPPPGYPMLPRSHGMKQRSGYGRRRLGSFFHLFLRWLMVI